VDFPQMMGNISRDILNSGKVILNQHNIEDKTMRSLANSMPLSLKKYLFLFDSYRLGLIESLIYRKNIYLYTFVSTDDKAYFEIKYNKKNTYHLPICCEIHPYLSYHESHKMHCLAMIGKMSYPANVEAATWFANNVFPKVQETVNDVKLYLVGKDPAIEVMRLSNHNQNIIVTGTVDDVSTYYNDATLIIIPLMHGGGVKVKLLEALGYGKLVVSTSKGVEGTYLKGQEHLLIADTAKDMTDICIDALNNSSKYEETRKRGYEYVKIHHSYEMVIDTFNNYIMGDNE
jgi:glycosyltransferase involved in cell wall biosynthesis